jgi:WD40 repeat protein
MKLFQIILFAFSVKVWDEKWFLKMVFVGHHSSVLSLANHPFAPYIISSSQDKTIKIWSLDQQDIVDK